ncbi:MAG: 50S ribosomal protein L24 [candidate division Zixibacteria bacterium]|nr:50S ribosomal protein L24 [candidate division Zixibacteria bacterium]
MNIKKGDNVVVISGSGKTELDGKVAKVLHVEKAKNRILVEGVNMMKRHTRPSQRNQKGGIISKEAPIHRSNVKIYCGSCSSPTRISNKVIEDKDKGTKSKVRCCRLCGAEL